MATRQRTTVYRTSGNAAYAPTYAGSTVLNPRRQEEEYLLPKRRERREPINRPTRELRQPGYVAPFAVLGFLAVGLFAVLLLVSMLQVHVASNAVASLRSELTTLQTENATLSAQYEQVFDMEHLQAAIGSEMVRPTANQITYIDMSQPDSVILYGKSTGTRGAGGFVDGVKEIFSSLIEYFH